MCAVLPADAQQLCRRQACLGPQLARHAAALGSSSHGPGLPMPQTACMSIAASSLQACSSSSRRQLWLRLAWDLTMHVRHAAALQGGSYGPGLPEASACMSEHSCFLAVGAQQLSEEEAMAQATARLRSAFAKRRAGGAAGGGLEQGSLAQRILASARAQRAAEAAAADAGQAANRAEEAAGGQLHNIIRRLQVSSCTPGHAVAGAAQAADGAQPEIGKCSSLLASACTLWCFNSDGFKKSPSAPACHAVTAKS